MSRRTDPCPACGSLQDPHSCPPEWTVWAERYPGISAEVRASDASMAGDAAAEKLGLPEGDHPLVAQDRQGRRYSGNVRVELRLSYVAVLLREDGR